MEVHSFILHFQNDVPELCARISSAESKNNNNNIKKKDLVYLWKVILLGNGLHVRRRWRWSIFRTASRKRGSKCLSKQRILALSCRFERYQTTALARDEEYVFAVMRVYLWPHDEAVVLVYLFPTNSENIYQAATELQYTVYSTVVHVDRLLNKRR